MATSTITINEKFTNKFLDGRILKKFTNIIPKGINIYLLEINKISILYLSKTKNGFKNRNYIGYIQFFFSIENTTVMYLDVNKKYRGNRISLFLFLLMSEYICFMGGNLIELDDDSDNAWDLDNNLYVKLGMIYINPKPYPEMIGYTCDIKNRWDKNKFTFKTFFNN